MECDHCGEKVKICKFCKGKFESETEVICMDYGHFCTFECVGEQFFNDDHASGYGQVI